MQKKLQSCFTKSFKISLFLLFILSSVAWLHDIWEIWIRDKIWTKSKTANHWSISTPQQVGPKQYCFQTHLIQLCRLGKIGLNFDIASPTKFVNFFSFFEKLATILKEQPSDYLKQFFWEASSCIKKTQQPNFWEFGNSHTITSSSKEQDLKFSVTSNTIIPSTLPALTMDERHSYWTKQIIIQKWTQFYQILRIQSPI